MGRDEQDWALLINSYRAFKDLAPVFSPSGSFPSAPKKRISISMAYMGLTVSLSGSVLPTRLGALQKA